MAVKNFFRSFKEFAIRGNVLDLIAGVVIATSLAAIAVSLVNDIILPLVGLLCGGVDFAQLTIVLVPATETASAITINYGLFIQKIFNFLIITFIVFLFINALNRVKKANEILKKKISDINTSVINTEEDTINNNKTE